MMENETASTISSAQSGLRPWGRIMLTSCLSVIIIIALFGNLIVVLIFSTYKPLRKISNSFMVSLAISDMLIAAVNIPSWIVTFVWRSTYSKLFRDVGMYLDIAAGVASILNLTAVSVYRYIQITNPYTYTEIVTKHRVIGSLVSIWMFAGLMAMLKGVIPRNPNSWFYQPGYQLLIFLISFALPLTGISYCYYRIFKEVARHRNRQPKTQSQQTSNWLVIDMKAIKTIAIVVVIFVICWCPFFFAVLVNGFCKCVTNQYLITFVKTLHYSNSALNPVIYVWYNQKYRKAFISALTKCAQYQGAEFVVTFLNNTDEGGQSALEDTGNVVFLRS